MRRIARQAVWGGLLLLIAAATIPSAYAAGTTREGFIAWRNTTSVPYKVRLRVASGNCLVSGGDKQFTVPARGAHTYTIKLKDPSQCQGESIYDGRVSLDWSFSQTFKNGRSVKGDVSYDEYYITATGNAKAVLTNTVKGGVVIRATCGKDRLACGTTLETATSVDTTYFTVVPIPPAQLFQATRGEGFGFSGK